MNLSKIHTHYRVKINNSGWLTEDGYSKYYERLRLRDAGKIQDHEVYGPEQAAEHIEEYFNTVDGYTESRQKDVLTIEEVTTITTPVKTVERPKLKEADAAICRTVDAMTRQLLLILFKIRDNGNALAIDAIYDVVHNRSKNLTLEFPDKGPRSSVFFSECVIHFKGEVLK